jgi:hypothetical protein
MPAIKGISPVQNPDLTVAGSWAGVQYQPPARLDLKYVEVAILRQLAQNIDSAAAEIAPFPQDWEQYSLKHQNGAVLLHWMGSEYQRQMPTDIVAQWRCMRWAMVCLSRNLGWSFGGEGDQFSSAYGLIELVRVALTGFQIPGFKQAYPVHEIFLGQKGAQWAYEIVFMFETYAIETPQTTSYPVFATGTFLDQSGMTNMAAAPAPYTFVGGQIALPNGNVSNVVVSNQQTAAVYSPGGDYLVDSTNGILTLTANSTIPSGSTVVVGYTYADATTATATGGD